MRTITARYRPELAWRLPRRLRRLRPLMSGQGREGGPWGLELYTQPKNVYVDLS